MLSYGILTFLEFKTFKSFNRFAPFKSFRTGNRVTIKARVSPHSPGHCSHHRLPNDWNDSDLFNSEWLERLKRFERSPNDR
jgi:hypothetical protein